MSDIEMKSNLSEADALIVGEKVALAMSVAEEVVGEEQLRAIYELQVAGKKKTIVAYDGFEPSGRMHIAQGILKSINVNKLTKTGVRFTLFVADWHAMLNNKMNGDMDKIRTVGLYFIEIWRALGMNLDMVDFKWASEIINDNADKYWSIVMTFARFNSLKRVKRCSTIMGRGESDDMPTAQVLYPLMQAADIFFLQAEICQLGLDQRKVNMLAYEMANNKEVKKILEKKYKLRMFKPVVLSHHMLLGLKEGQAKMSKSDPDSAIFMEDTDADVNRKIKKAFCPPGVVAENPILDYVRHIILPSAGALELVRTAENGGNRTYTSADDLERDFAANLVHPGDLKSAVQTALSRLLQPVRDHFQSTKELQTLLKKVQQYRPTK